jgi:cell division protein FtsN
VPDLNLKGEEKQESPAQAPRKRFWLISVLISSLLIVVAVVILEFQAGVPAANEDNGTQTAQASTKALDTALQVVNDTNSIASDSTKATLAAVNETVAPEDSSVVASDSPASVKERAKYRIQVSAWLSGSRAAKQARRLRRLGLDVDLVKSKPDSVGQVWNRILMGSYETLAEAKMVARAVLDTLVVGYSVVEEN